MDHHTDTPLLLTFYFGESASIAKNGASRRLKNWSQAFESWIQETTHTLQPDTTRHALLAWKRLVHQCGKLPWQITPGDIQNHLVWMQEQAFSTSTINTSLAFTASFYHWCNAHQIDSATPPGFNPVLAVPRLPKKPYQGATLWTQPELDAFFSLLARDESPLGKRDLAFFLLRLHSGVVLKRLLHLKWSQLDNPHADMHVRWQHDSPPYRLPPEVQQAILGYLDHSGRLNGMSSGKIIFAPLALPSLECSRTSAADWSELQPLSTSAILSSLKLYGRQVGIPDQKLNLITLRRTAIQRKFDQGETLPVMQAFMDTREKLKQTRYRLAHLQHLSHLSSTNLSTLDTDASIPIRNVQNFKPLNNLIRNFNHRKPDSQAVQAIIQENIHGLTDECACLRELMRLIYDYQGDSRRQMRAYSQAAHRLAVVLSTQVDRPKDENEEWADEVLARFGQVALDTGCPPLSPTARQENFNDPPGGPQPSGLVTEEIATIRWLLRDAYTCARQSLSLTEFLHQLDLYGIGCLRLASLLRVERRVGGGQLVQVMRAAIDQALHDLRKEWHLDE